MAGRHKGTPKTGGRVVGSINKTTAEQKELFNQLWANNLPKMDKAFQDVLLEDPAKYLELLAKYAQYFVPKKVEQDVNINQIEPPTIVIKDKK